MSRHYTVEMMFRTTMEISGKVLLVWFFIISFCDVLQPNNENYCEHLLPSTVQQLNEEGSTGGKC